MFGVLKKLPFFAYVIIVNLISMLWFLIGLVLKKLPSFIFPHHRNYRQSRNNNRPTFLGEANVGQFSLPLPVLIVMISARLPHEGLGSRGDKAENLPLTNPWRL
jgi:hypothetical protein